MIRKILLLFLLLVLAAPAAADTQVTFTWDPNTEPDLAGYRLYQSRISEDYDFTSPIAEIPAGTQTAVATCADGTFYWVLTAFDTVGNESLPSNEVMATLDSTAPAGPTGFTIQATVIIRIETPP